MKIEILKNFGLTKNDIKVYDSLFKIGRSKTGKIIEESKVASSRVYASLRHLTEKGLVTFIVKNNIKYYQAELPDKLIEDYKENVNELEELSKTLKTLPIQKTPRNSTNIYEGIHGFKLAFDNHISNIKKNEKIGVIGFNEQSIRKGLLKRYREFFSKVDEDTIKKTTNVRMMLDKDLLDVLKHKLKYYDKYDLRFLDKEYFGPIATNLSESEAMISVWGDKPIVFTMNNKAVVESFWKNFEILWSKASKK